MGDSQVGDAGLILEECRRLLAALRKTYAHDPAGEYQKLARLALEREQLVSYAYREDILGQRLEQLIAPPEVIEVMRHAFVQVWRDEEAHTVLIRGTLLAKERAPIGIARTSVEQAAGWLAGWAASLKHHNPRSAAPLRSLLVDGLAQGARLVGKLSADLRAELKPKRFKEFCQYNVDAEETAELCWQRLVELERQLGGSDVETFERIAREEREHRDVFETVASVLDHHDWLQPGTTVKSLEGRLAKIGDRFVVAQQSPLAASQFGRGGEVYVFDKVTCSRTEAINDSLDLLGDIEHKSIAIQASWMMGYSRRDQSSIVDPQALHHLVKELVRRGSHPTVIDGPNLYSDIFDGRSVLNVAQHFGIQPDCPVADARAEVVQVGEMPMLGPTAISKSWVDADLRISMVRLRSHPREHVHGATANLESLIADIPENVFWQRRYDHSVAAIAAGIVAPPHLALIDAWSDCPDGLFGLMAGSQVVHPGRLYASTDALSCDLVALRHTGSAQSVTSATLRRAIEWFGDPRPRIEVIGTDSDIEGWRNPYDNSVSGFLADLSYPVFAYLSRSGALFAPPMDDAFPEIKPLPMPLGLARSAARRALGLQPPRV